MSEHSLDVSIDTAADRGSATLSHPQKKVMAAADESPAAGRLSSYAWDAYVAEFVGTYFLVLTIGLNVVQENSLAPLSIGAILMVMIFAMGSVSGAHYNPAVTLAVYLSRRQKISLRDAGIYWGVQCLAGLIAGATFWGVLGDSFPLEPSAALISADGKAAAIRSACLVEILYTCALCFVILNVATTKQDTPNHYFGLAIGSTVGSAAIAIGGVSGCSLNPAVSIGVIITHAIASGSGAGLAYLGLYLLAPLVGSVFAAAVFYAVRPAEYGLPFGK
ncbi:unnamed protein product [Vitrella brassicaformis CCMP3155]|uniref:Aquaporin n=1 Tax=Vitrella brassicaformis (strain CCMP3155) TaxID=1169540 RepID=A0A0G4EYK8_VITBC|nr:unnamed protein product [Vitrella brassicaformis CCMP3155]|mmetsp:Transcript_27435/g.68435  ORF Transcript_27435/g.68435 Transcript_27435/m.68435 type:complete len:276 (-) Transcript_27435:211-1038(-)|eukprot:CEM04143.1 unnamed protein product [Vitrella brassicaformis CCMP3155]